MNYKAYWEKAISYSAYREGIGDLLAEGKTTGENHSEAMLDYTRMNLKRMKRIDRTYTPSSADKDFLSQKGVEEYWLLITEAWCGDAAQILPALKKMADSQAGIKMRLVLRDENLELMDQFLTNGVSRSIPILIRLSTQDFSLLGKWGPRPAAAQQILIEGKEKAQSADVMKEAIHLWYARNKIVDIESEIMALYS